MLRLSKRLVERGSEVEVITSNYPPGRSVEDVQGIKVRRLRCVGRILRNPLTPGFLSLRKHLKKFDIVHTHNEHSSAAISAAFLRSSAGVPLVLTCHGQLRFDEPISDWLEATYTRTLGRHVFRATDSIIALTPSDKDYITTLGIDEKKIRVIPNAVDLSAFSSTGEHDGRFLEKHGLTGKRTVLFVGPMLKRKGAEFLLKAISRIARKREDIACVFAGDGPDLQRAESVASRLNLKRHTVFLGRVSRSELLRAYRGCHLFVCSSLSEGLPTTIMEASAMSLPVISSALPGISDFFGETAILTEPGDVEDLESAILDTLWDDDKLVELGLRGRRLIEEELNWEKVSAQILAFYKDTLESHCAS